MTSPPLPEVPPQLVAHLLNLSNLTLVSNDDSDSECQGSASSSLLPEDTDGILNNSYPLDDSYMNTTPRDSPSHDYD